MRWIRQYLHGIATFKHVAERNDFPVYLCSDTEMTKLGMDRVRKIYRCCALGEFSYIPLGCEYVDFIGVEIDLEDLHEFLAIFQFVLPLDDAPEPGEHLVFLRVEDRALFIFPVRGNPFFSDLVHVVGPDLDFNFFTVRPYDLCVERLIHIPLGQRDIIAEFTRYGFEERMNETKRLITVFNVNHDDPESDDVINIIYVESFLYHFAVDAVQLFCPPGNFGLQMKLIKSFLQ